MEKTFGFISVTNKTSSGAGVFFYVQKNNALKGPAVVRFDVQRENSGRAMNRFTGVFTVPKPGAYHFAFIGLKSHDFDQFIMYLRVNGVKLASFYSGVGPVMYPVAIHSTLKLKMGDRVDIFIEKGTGRLH